jgi:hypothetical protein
MKRFLMRHWPRVFFEAEGSAGGGGDSSTHGEETETDAGGNQGENPAQGGGSGGGSGDEGAGGDSSAHGGGTGQTAAGETDEWYKGWWAGQLPSETIEKHGEMLKTMKGKKLSEVFDEFVDAKARLGRAVEFPGKGAKPEEISAFLKKMDVPETPDGYGLDARLLPGDGGGLTKAVAEKMHSLALTKLQGKRVFEEFAALQNEGLSRIKAARDERAKTFEARLEAAAGSAEKAAEAKEWYKRALVAFHDKGLVKELSDSGMAYSTALALALADTWKAFNAEPLIPRGGHGSGGKKDALVKSEEFEKAYPRR